MSISGIFDFLTQGWVGSIIGALGIMVAIVIYRLALRRSSLCYESHGIQVIGNVDSQFPDELKIFFKDIEVPQVTKSSIVLWNDGQLTISRSDLVQSDPLRIILDEGAHVLRAKVNKATRDVLNVTTAPSQQNAQEVAIEFEFLDSGDGAVIEVVHTGKQRHLSVVGTVKGIPRGIRFLGPMVSGGEVRPFRSWVGIFVMLSFGIVMLAYGIFTPTEILVQIDQHWAGRAVIITLGLLVFSLAMLSLWLFRRRYPKVLHVEAFEE